MSANLVLPLEPLFILYTLQKAGFQGYLVGGVVRDVLRNELKPTTDFDFTTNAKPEEILALFPESFYENQFGTVSMAPKHLHEMMGWPVADSAADSRSTPEPHIAVTQATKLHVSLQPASLPTHNLPPRFPNYEITTFRADGSYTDHRRPDQVTWGKSIEDDLSRRDFTINAMALELDAGSLAELFGMRVPKDRLVELSDKHYQVIDLFHGQQDLDQHLINTVGDPVDRFKEDALRMLRAIRFSVQLNMRMSDEVFTAISGLADQIQHVSWERVRDEFMKMLASEFPAEAIELLEETGLLHFILPELREGKGVEQGGHHTTDVWTHSIDALRSCPSSDPIVRLATLLHDIAKPATYRWEEGARKPTFYNHEVVGARVAKGIAQRLRLSKFDQDRIFTLVRWHMFHYQPHETDSAIRRFMRRVGLDNVNDILDLREADRLGSGARQTSWRLEEMKQRMIDQLHQPFAITDLAITGNDLMSELHLEPSRVIGEILKFLFEQVLEQPELNDRTKLLELAKTYLDHSSPKEIGR
jgi:poly(A) polymerase/tRNA nucleotidyltransferase (CCA-adding enzyme)